MENNQSKRGGRVYAKVEKGGVKNNQKKETRQNREEREEHGGQGTREGAEKKGNDWDLLISEEPRLFDGGHKV